MRRSIQVKQGWFYVGLSESAEEWLSAILRMAQKEPGLAMD